MRPRKDTFNSIQDQLPSPRTLIARAGLTFNSIQDQQEKKGRQKKPSFLSLSILSKINGQGERVPHLVCEAFNSIQDQLKFTVPIFRIMNQSFNSIQDQPDGIRYYVAVVKLLSILSKINQWHSVNIAEDEDFQFYPRSTRTATCGSPGRNFTFQFYPRSTLTVRTSSLPLNRIFQFYPRSTVFKLSPFLPLRKTFNSIQDQHICCAFLLFMRGTFNSI